MDIQTLDWLAKAEQNLAAAEHCLVNGWPDAAVNRAYYAMFQAGIAILIRHSVRARGDMWGHDYVQSQVNEQLIKRKKVLPGNLKSDLNQGLLTRHRADYKPVSVGLKVAKQMQRRAHRFVAAIQGVLYA